jgi:hypothetical protein
MASSSRIARILGPTLIALGVTEPINLGVFAHNPAPVVYLNGTVLFVAGLAIVQAHNRWVRGWPVLVTLAGWILGLGGLYRMALPQAPQIGRGLAADAVFAVLIAVGAVLTYQGYRPGQPQPKPRRRPF